MLAGHTMMDSPLENGITDTMMRRVLLQCHTNTAQWRGSTLCQRALTINVDLDSEVFKDLDPPARGANPVMEAPTASTVMQTPHISPLSTDAQEQQSELAASISPQTSTHQPWDFSESGPAATIHEADPPAESAATSTRMTQQQPWRHDANAPALPPSPMVEPQSAMGLIDVPENPYGSDLKAPAPHDDTKSDQDEEASLEDEFCPVSDDGGEDEDMEHGQGASMSGVGSAPLFTALHTVVNEYCEIRPMLFMMMKGHDRYMPNLCEIKVQAVFTNNVCADKNELESWTVIELSNTHQTAPFLENGVIKLPHSLLVFLHLLLFKKVGVSVGADFKRLQNDCGIHHGIALDELFAGHMEWGAMAKECGATVKRTVGLAKLIRILLGRHLPKDPQVHVSPQWADAVLPQEYINYAVLNVYAVSQPIVATTPSGTAIALLAPDGQEVAHGIVALEHPPALNGVVKVKEAKSLASFSSTPFSIVANIQNLCICPSTHNEGSDGPLSGSCTETLGDHQDPELKVLDAGYIDSSSPLTSTLVLNEDEYDGDLESSPEQTIEGSLWLFARALSAAFFIPVAEDKAAMEAVLKDFGMTSNAQLLSIPEWVLSCVQHHVPPPEILLPHVADIIRTYGPIKDATTGQPLFNDHAWEIAKHVMENVQLGYYLDPTDVDLYFEIGKDRHGLMLYHCCRGTNSVKDALVPESSDFWCGWVNGNDYELAHETFSMIQCLPAFFKPLGMLEFDEVFAHEQNIQHKFIAESQGMLMAILPVHTREEHDLFQFLIQLSPLFLDSNWQPNWTALTVVWAGHADGYNIFYKLPEHLKTYYKTWTDFCNEQNTILLNAESQDPHVSTNGRQTTTLLQQGVQKVLMDLASV
ncbi:hypothetical protein BDR06DRAFT_967438 [Suillus hirtellus]|nr:hypothetical protein BDR06DRAFT_967438 [Suillus hirtellus]